MNLEHKKEYKLAIENKIKVVQFQKEKKKFVESMTNGNLHRLSIQDEVLIWIQKIYLKLKKFTTNKMTNDEIKELIDEISTKKYQIPTEILLFFIEIEKKFSLKNQEKLKKSLIKLIESNESQIIIDEENVNERIKNLENLIKVNEKTQMISKEELENSKLELNKLIKLNEIESDLTNLIQLNLFKITKIDLEENEEFYKNLFEFQLKIDIKKNFLSKKLITQSKEKYQMLINLKKQNENLMKLTNENGLLKFYFLNEKYKEAIKFDSSKEFVIKAFQKLLTNEMKIKKFFSPEEFKEFETLKNLGNTLQLSESSIFKEFLNFIETNQNKLNLKKKIERNLENKEIDALNQNLKETENFQDLKEFLLINQKQLIVSKNHWLKMKNYIFIKENILNLILLIRRKETKPKILECLIQPNKQFSKEELLKELENVILMILEHFMKMYENGNDLKSIGDESNNKELKYLIRKRFYFIMTLIFENGFQISTHWWKNSFHFWNFIENCSNETKESFKNLGEIELYNVVTQINEIALKNQILEDTENFKFMSFLCHSLKY